MRLEDLKPEDRIDTRTVLARLDGKSLDPAKATDRQILAEQTGFFIPKISTDTESPEEEQAEANQKEQEADAARRGWEEIGDALDDYVAPLVNYIAEEHLGAVGSCSLKESTAGRHLPERPSKQGFEVAGDIKTNVPLRGDFAMAVNATEPEALQPAAPAFKPATALALG